MRYLLIPACATAAAGFAGSQPTDAVSRLDETQIQTGGAVSLPDSGRLPQTRSWARRAQHNAGLLPHYISPHLNPDDRFCSRRLIPGAITLKVSHYRSDRLDTGADDSALRDVSALDISKCL